MVWLLFRKPQLQPCPGSTLKKCCYSDVVDILGGETTVADGATGHMVVWSVVTFAPLFF